MGMRTNGWSYYMARVYLFYTGYMTNIENKQLQIYLSGDKIICNRCHSLFEWLYD
jgi:hypothetical protein